MRREDKNWDNSGKHQKLMFSSGMSVLCGQTLTKKLDIRLWDYSCLCRALQCCRDLTAVTSRYHGFCDFFPNSKIFNKIVVFRSHFFFFFFLAQSHRPEISAQRHGDTMQAGKFFVSSHLLLLILWHPNRVNMQFFLFNWPELWHFCTAFLS